MRVDESTDIKDNASLMFKMRKSIQFLMPFVTTYTCEAVYLKNKYPNRLDVEPNLKIKLTSLPPNLKLLCDDQHHPSH